MASVPEVQRVSHFEIVQKLGEGGMGVVYRARDIDLGRQVALKFLPAQLVSSPERIARFRREARALSALNHPRIATIYGIEEARHVIFLVLEFLPGGTLRQKELACKSTAEPLPLGRCVEWAAEMAEGLAHAHQRGIVHRDIKPSNVLFTEEGELKIADFGLAKIAVEAGGGDVESSSGHTMGTPAYMAPEQVRGQEVDARSDIFSLGILLFELIAGEMPFRSTDNPGVMHDIAYTAAPRLESFREGVPETLQAVISRMLEKDPDARYQTANELLADLRALHIGAASEAPSPLAETKTMASAPGRKRRGLRIATAVSAGGLLAVAAVPPARHNISEWIFRRPIPVEKRVAVLPFVNIGGDAALADGLFEVVSNALTRLEQFHGTLLVVPASDVRKDNVTSVRDAGKLFGANLAVTGSIQRIGNGVQVTIGVSDTRTVTQLRSATIRAQLPELGAIQDDVVATVAQMFEVALAPEAAQSIRSGETKVRAAYPSYVEGLGYLRRYDQPENIGKAIACFERAVGVDPHYALAYVGLAGAYKRHYDIFRDTESIDAALEDGSKALALDGQLAPAHVAMGMVRAAKGEYERAEGEFQEALNLDPRGADAYRELASVYGAMNRPDRAEATYKQAIELRHDDWWSVKQLGVFYFTKNRFSDAERCFRQVIRMTPDSAKAYSNLGGLYAQMGRYGDAAVQLQKSTALAPTSDGYANLGYIYYYEEKYAEAAHAYEKAIQLAPNNSYFRGNLADAYRWNPSLAVKAPDAYRQAIEMVQREISINPRDARLHSQAAMWWAAIGSREEAEAEIAKAIELAPHDGEVQFRATVVYEQAGRRGRALKAAAAALKEGFPSEQFHTAPPLKGLREDPRYIRLMRSGKQLH